MNRFRIALLSILIFGCSPESDPKDRTQLLAFCATWCGPCHQMDPILDDLEAAGYTIRRVDVDQYPELAEKYRIQSLPTFVVVKDNREVSRMVGVTSRKRLIASMK